MGHMPMYCSSITLDGEYPPGYLKGVESGRIDPNAFTNCVGSGASETEDNRNTLEPLFVKYGVDVFFAGHEHNYESQWPTIDYVPMQVDYLDPLGPVHIVTGFGGPPGCDVFGPPGPYTRKQISAMPNYGYSRVTVKNKTHLRQEYVYNVNGTVGDTLWIIQNDHGPFKPPPPKDVLKARVAANVHVSNTEQQTVITPRVQGTPQPATEL